MNIDLRPAGSDLDARADLCREIALSAGETALAGFARQVPGGYRMKGPQDFLTETDAAVEAHVRAAIAAAFPEDGFLEGLRRLATEAGALLIFDEVVMGFRVARGGAQELYGVVPDLACYGKVIGGGYPLAAVAGARALMQLCNPRNKGAADYAYMSGTLNGNAVAATAGRFALERIQRPAFLARVRTRAVQLERGLAKLAKRHRSLREARGLGLLRAVELHDDCGFDPRELIRTARWHGLLLVRGGDRAVRVLPPLVATPNDIRVGLSRLDAALDELESRPRPPEENR